MVCDGIIIFGSLLDKVCTSIEEEQWREGEKRNWHAAGLRFETTVLLTTLCYTVSHCTTLCLNVHTRMCLRPHFTTMYQNVPMTTLYHTLPLTTQLPGGCCHTQTTPPPHLHRGIRLCPTLAHTKCHSATHQVPHTK